MRYQPIGLLRSQPKAIPSVYPLVTTADFIEAKKSNFDGINKRVLRAAIVKVLQKQAYMIHQMALTRFCLENSAAAKSVPKHFFNVTPQCFTPTPREIDLYRQDPKFLWRFSTNNYQFFVDCFTLSSSKHRLNDLSTYDRDDGLLVSYLIAPKKISLSKSFLYSKEDTKNYFEGKVASFLNERFRPCIKEGELVEHYFSDDYHLHEFEGELNFVTFTDLILTGQHNSVPSPFSLTLKASSNANIKKSMRESQSSKISWDIWSNKYHNKSSLKRGINFVKLTAKKSKVVRNIFNDDEIPLNFDISQFNNEYKLVPVPPNATSYMSQKKYEESQLRIRNLVAIADRRKRFSRKAFLPQPSKFQASLYISPTTKRLTPAPQANPIASANDFQPKSNAIPSQPNSDVAPCNAITPADDVIKVTVQPTQRAHFIHLEQSESTQSSIDEKYVTASTSPPIVIGKHDVITESSKESETEVVQLDVKQNECVERNYSCVVQNEKTEKKCVNCVESIASNESDSSWSISQLPTQLSAYLKKDDFKSESNVFETCASSDITSDGREDKVATPVESGQSDSTLLDSPMVFKGIDSANSAMSSGTKVFGLTDYKVDGPIVELIESLKRNFSTSTYGYPEMLKDIIKKEAPGWKRSKCPSCKKLPIVLDCNDNDDIVVLPKTSGFSWEMTCVCCNDWSHIYPDYLRYAKDVGMREVLPEDDRKFFEFVKTCPRVKQYLIKDYDDTKRYPINSVLIDFFFFQLHHYEKVTDKMILARREFAHQFVAKIPSRFYIHGIDFVELFIRDDDDVVGSYMDLHDDVVKHLDAVFEQLAEYQKAIPFIKQVLGKTEAKDVEIDSNAAEITKVATDLISFELIPFELSEFANTDEFKMEVAQYLADYALKYHPARISSYDQYVRQRILIQMESPKHAMFVYACARDKHLSEVFFIVNHMKSVVHKFCGMERYSSNFYAYDKIHYSAITALDINLRLENIRVNLETFVGKYIETDLAPKLFDKNLLKRIEQKNGDFKSVIHEDTIGGLIE